MGLLNFGVQVPRLPRVPSPSFLAVASDAVVSTPGSAGSGDSIAPGSGSSFVLTDAAGAFAASDVGTWITITGATNAANNGSFPVTARTTTTCTYTNAAGVAEAVFPGQYSVGQRFGSLTDQVSGEAYTEATATNRPAAYYLGDNTAPLWPGRVPASAAALAVSRVGTTGVRLTATGSAVAAAFNGFIDSSLAIYYGSATNPTPTGTPDLLFFGNTTNGIRVRQDWAGGDVSLTRYEAGASTAVVLANITPPTAPMLFGLTWTGSVIRPYTYSRATGAVTALATVAPGTIRSPAGMTALALMSSTTGGSGEYFLGWAGAAGVVWEEQHFLELGAWFDRYQFASNCVFPV